MYITEALVQHKQPQRDAIHGVARRGALSPRRPTRTPSSFRVSVCRGDVDVTSVNCSDVHNASIVVNGVHGSDRDTVLLLCGGVYLAILQVGPRETPRRDTRRGCASAGVILDGHKGERSPEEAHFFHTFASFHLRTAMCTATLYYTGVSF